MVNLQTGSGDSRKLVQRQLKRLCSMINVCDSIVIGTGTSIIAYDQVSALMTIGLDYDGAENAYSCD
jgi:hypothetical protein